MEEGAATLLQFVDTFGSLGLLASLAWMFMTGKILSRTVVDDMLKAERDNANFLKDEILDRLGGEKSGN